MKTVYGSAPFVGISSFMSMGGSFAPPPVQEMERGGWMKKKFKRNFTCPSCEGSGFEVSPKGRTRKCTYTYAQYMEEKNKWIYKDPSKNPGTYTFQPGTCEEGLLPMYVYSYLGVKKEGDPVIFSGKGTSAKGCRECDFLGTERIRIGNKGYWHSLGNTWLPCTSERK